MAILTAQTSIGYVLPAVSRRLSPELNRVVGEEGGDVQTLHNDAEAAAREGLKEPIAVASRPASLIYRMMLMCFGEGWIVGGKGSLTYRRPVGIRDFVTAKGVVREKITEGANAVRIICEVWVETEKGVKAIVGTCSGLVAR
jgi:acyl dehydratase